jgi:hypothetical protein
MHVRNEPILYLDIYLSLWSLSMRRGVHSLKAYFEAAMPLRRLLRGEIRLERLEFNVGAPCRLRLPRPHARRKRAHRI